MEKLSKQWENLMIPYEEAERSWREIRPEKPSYWGEKEVSEWGRKIREERSKLAEERKGEMSQPLREGFWLDPDGSVVYWNSQEKVHVSRCLRIPNLHSCNHIKIDKL